MSDIVVEKGKYAYVDIICKYCVHYKKSFSCDAFPKRGSIPAEIYSGKNDHSEPLPNQGNNIVFEAICREA